MGFLMLQIRVEVAANFRKVILLTGFRNLKIKYSFHMGIPYFSLRGLLQNWIDIKKSIK